MIIRKRGNKFYVVVRKDGKEKWYGGNTIEEAQKKAENHFTVKSFTEYYLSNIEVKEKTKDFYKYALTSLYKKYEKKLLIDLSTLDLQDWIATLKTPQTKKDYFSAVRTALKRAMAWELINKEIWKGVIIPKTSKTTGRAYTLEETKTLIKKSKNTELYIFILLGIFCGLRISEMCGLRKDRIKDGYIIIDAQLQRTTGNKNILNIPTNNKTKIALTSPKTVHSASKIPCPNIVLNAINNLSKINDLYNTNLLLLQNNGRPYEPSLVRKHFKAFCKKNNLPYYRLHDLRHTTATLLLEAGVDPLTVKNQMRHADVSTTQNIYQHLSEEIKKQPANIFDKLFSDNRQVGNQVGTHIEEWSGRRDSNSRPLVPETNINNQNPEEMALLLLCGIKWFILSRYNLYFFQWTSGKK